MRSSARVLCSALCVTSVAHAAAGIGGRGSGGGRGGGNDVAATCSPTGDFPVDLTGYQYRNLEHSPGPTDVASCAQACCDKGDTCKIYQYSTENGCWVGGWTEDPYPDPTHEYQSRGRDKPPAPAPAPAGPYPLDDSGGLGLRWEGVGAISGGGATTKLLKDYDAAVASDVLDFLFKPSFGLGLQILKVELGGDTDATEGAEPSHMHYAGDEDYNRGYEWWLMKEAKARNPDIKLYGLPWGWPGWLDPSATPDKEAKNAFAHPNVTANYTLAWLRGGKREHDLDIDYIGQWNERDAPAAYNTALRDLVASDSLVNGTTCLNRLPHYPGTTDHPDPQGCTQYEWNTTDGSRWVDEEGSIFDGRSARCLARCVNRNYISGCHTATFQWHLVSSFYDYLPWSRCGVAVANTPWSGHYEITSPTWALAHTTQFAPVGWRYARHNSGVQMLGKGGSLVTRLSPDGRDFSVVVEKMTSADSACARGSNPESMAEEEDVELVLAGSFKAAAAAAGGKLQVWYSDLNSGGDEGTNPPDAQLFQRLAPATVSADGTRVTLAGVKPNEIYTLTTLTTGAKGTPASGAIPPPKAFPLPFTQTFDDETPPAPPALWYDQMGAWEVQVDPYVSPSSSMAAVAASNGVRGSPSNNHVMRQLSTVWPSCWGYSCAPPTTYFGPSQFNASTAVSVDVRLEDHGNWTLAVEGGSSSNGGGGTGSAGARFTLATDGSWALSVNGKTAGSGAAGAVSFGVNVWHTAELRVGTNGTVASLGGKALANVPATVADGWRVQVQLSRYVFASMDNFKLTPM